MPIRLQALGGLHAFRDDVPLAWVPAQHVSSALLVYLTLEHDVTREHLARVFWPDEELESARHALRQALYRLRHAAGEGLTEDTGDVLRLAVPMACDALEFERAVEASDFAGALALYRGAFLKDVSLSASPEFEAWTDRQRARFSRLHRRACRARIEGLVHIGAVAEAIEAARAWVTLEPFDDEAQHRLVELLAGSGQRAEALAQYERYERLLKADELEPLDETKALVALLRAGEVGVSALAPALHPPAGLVAAPLVSGPQAPPVVPAGAGASPEKTLLAQLWTRRRWPLVTAGAIALASVGIASVWALQSRPLSITVSHMTPVTTDHGVEYLPAISPDGREVAYTAGPVLSPRLVIRSTANVAGGGEVRLTDPAFEVQRLPAWSADGDLVRFAACQQERKNFMALAQWRGCSWQELGKLGGVARPAVLPPGARSSHAAWSADGSRVAFVVGDTIFSAVVGDTVVRRLAVHSSDFAVLHSLAWSPDGELIAYVNGNAQWLINGNDLASSIWIVAAGGGEPREVVKQEGINMSPAWLDAHHLLFVSNRDGPRGLYVVAVGERGARGEPRLVPGIAEPHSISYSIGARKLAWARFTWHQNIWSYPLEHSAPISIADGQAVTSSNELIWDHDVSPDGRWLAYGSNRRGNLDIFRMPLPSGEPLAVAGADMLRNEGDPHWSPDGKEIAYWVDDPSCPGGLWQTAVIPADGGVAREITCTPGGGGYYARWSPDGLTIGFMRDAPDRSHSTELAGFRQDIWATSRDSVGGTWGEPVRLTDFLSAPMAATPDGRGLLGMSLDGAELFVVAFDGRVVWRYDLAGRNGLTTGFPDARYSQDGRTIYFGAVHRDGREGIWALPVTGGAARLVVAFDDPALTSPFGGMISLGPDRLYLTVAEYQSDIWVADLRY